jgi:hypothetical protein
MQIAEYQNIAGEKKQFLEEEGVNLFLTKILTPVQIFVEKIHPHNRWRRCDALVAEYLIICKINPIVLSSLLIHHLVNIF